MAQELTVQFTECDKEQIQFIDRIQPYGALIVTDIESKIVAAAASEDFHLNCKALLGKTLQEVLQADSSVVLKMLGERVDATRPILLRSKTWKRWMTCIAYNQGDFKVFELEFLPIKEVEIPSINFIRERKEPLYTYLNYIVDNLRNVTGYDRIMVYRFAPDWHGEVVAESLAENAASLLGQHFPASDIPAPARDLFLKNWVRSIFDVDAPTIDVVSIDNQPINLARSILRAPSEIHIEYLKNMGVGASLTLSLIQDGRLWGLIACHHPTKKYLTAEERAICMLIAKLVSTRITSFATAETMAAIQRVSIFTNNLAANLTEGQFDEAIRDQKISLMSFVSCDGFCSFGTKDLIREGETPSAEEIHALCEYLDKGDQELVCTESIARLAPELADRLPTTVGFLAAKLDHNWLIWFRKELRNSRLWAGNPTKPNLPGDDNARVSPRKSFEIWTEQMQGTSIVWEPGEINAAQRLRTEILRTLDGTRRVASVNLDDYQDVLDMLVLEATDKRH